MFLILFWLLDSQNKLNWVSFLVLKVKALDKWGSLVSVYAGLIVEYCTYQTWVLNKSLIGYDASFRDWDSGWVTKQKLIIGMLPVEQV